MLPLFDLQTSPGLQLVRVVFQLWSHESALGTLELNLTLGVATQPRKPITHVNNWVVFQPTNQTFN